MSRIQDILSKAERDGTARRTRALSHEGHGLSAVEAHPLSERQRVDGPGLNERQRVEGQPASRPARPPQGAYEPLVRDANEWHPAAAPSVQPEARMAEAAVLDARLVAALAPQSLAAEQYRSLRTRIKRAENGRAVRAIVITSPNKGDGKSLTAANLAITMGQEFQQRVLLIDGDLRRAAVHRLFSVAEGPGLADVLMGAADLSEALVDVPEHHVTLLPAGAPPSHPAELLGSASMRRLLDSLRTRFDRILIDMPPVAPLADLHIVAPMVDGLLMIVRAGVTPKPAIERALSGLDVSKVLGLVLNEAGRNESDASTYEGYGYIAG